MLHRRSAWSAIAGVVSVAILGCNASSQFGSLEGRWAGTIDCAAGSSELSMTLAVDGSRITGNATIRSRGSTNSQWRVEGTAATTCDRDTCRNKQDCASAAGELRTCAYNPKCVVAAESRKGCAGVPAGANAECDPCRDCTDCLLCKDCQPDWLPLHVTLRDSHIQVPDPTLKLWRAGGARLEGTIARFCTNETQRWPKVTANKE